MMRKLLFFLAFTGISAWVAGQGTAHTMADFETVTPSIFAPANAGTAQVIANPVQEGINTSANVLEFVRTGEKDYQNCGMTFPTPYYAMNKIVKVEFKMYGDISSIFVQALYDGGGAVNIAWANNLTKTGWNQYSYTPDYSTDAHSLKSMAFFPNMLSATDAGTYYIDDVVIYVLEAGVESVSLPATLNLAVSETSQLVPEITPSDAANQNVTWESSNTDIATVDANGNVTGVAEGSCDVTVTTEDGGFQATTAVTVAGVLELQEIHLNFTALTMVPGEIFMLDPSFVPANAPDTTITWSSTDESVATVDGNGVINVLKTGTTTIRATAGNTPTFDECAVTVIEEAPFALANDTIANFETVFPNQGEYPGEWQFYGVGIDSATAVVANPAQDAVNGTPFVAKQERTEGTWRVMGFSLVGGLPITSDMESVEFLIRASNLEKVNAVINFIQDGAVEGKMGETPWPWDAPAGANAWNKIVLPIDAVNYLNDTITNINIFANPMNSDPSAVTVYIDEVIINRVVHVTGLSLDQASATIEVGDDLYLTPTIEPANASNETVTWSSSDEGVATVNSFGKVTGVSAGSATITATSEDGGFEATCSVTVEPAQILIETITIPGTLSLDVDDEYTFSPSITPTNATETGMSWSSSDDNVATVDAGGTVTAIAEGTATITVEADMGGVTANCVVTVSDPNGISMNDLPGFKVYPNPYAGGALTVEFSEDVASDMMVTIFDLAGKAVYSKEESVYGRELILAPELQPGLYLLKISHDQTVDHIRLQVK